MKTRMFAAAAFTMVSVSARASDQPLYQTAPAWVFIARLPLQMTGAGGTPSTSYDFQQRFADGQSWGYFDVATRITSPEQLSQNATLTLPWYPDKGDLIIHEVSILRGGETVDVIGSGQKFTVLRREQNLEQQQLTGVLTATLAVEGLRVGDTLRVRASITIKDQALAGHVQWTRPLLAQPAQTSQASMRLLWPKAQAFRWKLISGDVATRASSNGGDNVLNVTLPVPKPVEMPDDAPRRFLHPPLIEATTFASWADVSRTMAPLYSTDDAITPGSALAREVSRITGDTTDPMQRIARAMRLVQDDVRYLALSMDGGNYVPQPPEKTWSVRYGDCKAKTLLLLAMLRAMQIAAEPVMANLGLDDLVPDRLPAASAFNHILVRARVGGESIWLDGTGSGTRLADLHDTPAFRYVLPVRAEGSTVEEINREAPARPTTDLTLRVDESTSIDLPSVIEARLVLRGPRAAALASMSSQVGTKEKSQLLHGILSAFLGDGQFTGLTISENSSDATVTVTGHGIVSTRWKQDEHRRKRDVSQLMEKFSFSPDRARAAWSAIPVATGEPDRMHVQMRLHLPDSGRAYILEGTPTFKGEVAGYSVVRETTLRGNELVIDEGLSSRAAEISPSAIPAERDAYARAMTSAPRLLAPLDALRRWEISSRGKVPGTQLAAVNALFAAAVGEAEPEDTSALEGYISFLKGIGNYRAALAASDRIITLAPSAENYVVRARLEMQLGDLPAAARDADAARGLDPSDLDALGLASEVAARRGEFASAVKMLDERIALGGHERDGLRLVKAEMTATYGEPLDGIAQLDELIAKKPGRPELLNARCWAKASRLVEIETALKDCTSAIELTDNSAPILDSRAVVWLRMGRLDSALNDLDAALLQDPSLGPTRLVRAIVLKKLGRSSEAQNELAAARSLAPDAEDNYRRFGLIY